VKQSTDCEVFQDQLDALNEGTLGEEGIEQLRRHADSCLDCAKLLDIHERLTSPSVVELEAAVPDQYVSSMWERVRADVAAQESGRRWRPGVWQPSRWLVPTMAAASLFLLFATGFLLGELKRLRGREQVLVQRVIEHEKWLAELDLRTTTDPLARTAGLVTKRPWERVLSRRESVSISELEELLERLPARTTIVGASEWEALLESVPFWMNSAWRGAIELVRADDGIQPGELLELLGNLDVDPSRKISTNRILALTRRPVRPGRL
jgi:hypothetical protein